MNGCQYYEKYNNDVSLVLSNTAATTGKSLSVDSETAFRQWVFMTRDVSGKKQTIHFMGGRLKFFMAETNEFSGIVHFAGRSWIC